MNDITHETAGGVVFDAQGRILVIERDVVREGVDIHEVRLPKGHIDPGESLEAAALREVGEESGYWGVAIAGSLGTAVSAYAFGGKHYVRREHCFLMQLRETTRGDAAPCSAEEALFSPAWLDAAAAEQAMTYESEREFVRRARAQLLERVQQQQQQQ